jgi:hypothetical protein
MGWSTCTTRTWVSCGRNWARIAFRAASEDFESSRASRIFIFLLLFQSYFYAPRPLEDVINVTGRSAMAHGGRRRFWDELFSKAASCAAVGPVAKRAADPRGAEVSLAASTPGRQRANTLPRPVRN